MFCLYCGTPLPNDAVFCNKCGKSQKNAAQMSTQGPLAASNSPPHPTQAAPDSDSHPEIGQFLHYLSTNRGIQPVRRTVALGAHAADPPTFFNTLPSGDVFLYPRFLIFLTLTQGNYGAGMLVGKFAQSVQARLKLAGWVAHPETFLLEVARSLSAKYSQRDNFEKALNNLNSIFIPLDEMTNVHAGRKVGQGRYIQLSMPGRNAIICQDIRRENTLKSLSSMLTSSWEPELLAALQDAVRKNSANRPIARPPMTQPNMPGSGFQASSCQRCGSPIYPSQPSCFRCGAKLR